MHRSHGTQPGQTPTIETPRLLLRPLDLLDADELQRVFPRWEIVQYLSSRVPWPYPADGARKFLQDVVSPGMARGTGFFWAIRPLDGDLPLIGVINLRTEAIDHNRGFWLAPEWRGRGLMSEAVGVANEFWFERIGREVLRTSKASANHGSRKLLERSGMRLVGFGVRDYVCGRLPTDIWEISRDEWRARHAA
jgi:RimJ/RimL family protein N-acetyltransferase